MNKCLCCGKPLKGNNIQGWHKSCIKSFFESDELPVLDLSEENLISIATESVKKKTTVTGVQRKLSLNLSRGEDNRLTIVNYPAGYILKPQSNDYEYLPEYEYLAMCMAREAKIRTVPNALIENNGQYAYITKRIDREITDYKVNKLAMEDFCQLSNKLTFDKYKSSYEWCGKIIRKHSIKSEYDCTELFKLVLFSYIIGNSDMHLKNFSLIETSPGSREYSLSAAYDILPANMVIPEDDEELALTLNGKKKNLTKNDFISFGININLSEKVIFNMIRQICSFKDTFIQEIRDSYLPSHKKEEYVALIEKRISIFC